MTKFEEIIKEFNENLFEKDLQSVNELTERMFDELCFRTHCPKTNIEVVEDDENYLYKNNSKKIVVNFNMIKHFQKFAHLFLLNTLFIIIRAMMQSNFKVFLQEREKFGGKFFVVEDNSNLPLNFQQLFKLDNVMLLYAEIEKDKQDFYSITMFDRRAFAYACMENYLQLTNYIGGKDYLQYLKEDFTLSSEDAKADTPLQLEDKIIAKFKSENQLVFLEELELREQVFKQIENVLGE